MASSSEQEAYINWICGQGDYVATSGVTRVPCAPAFTPNFAQIIKMTVKFGVSFELLINRGSEKNNEGERLTKQETKKS